MAAGKVQKLPLAKLTGSVSVQDSLRQLVSDLEGLERLQEMERALVHEIRQQIQDLEHRFGNRSAAG